MSLLNLPRFALNQRDGNHLTLTAPLGPVAHLFVLEVDIIRVLVLPDGALRQGRSWTICPGQQDLPAEGRDRFDLDGFALPPFELAVDADRLVITTGQLRLTVDLQGLCCRWETRRDDQWQAIAADRKTQSYNFGWWDHRVYHYLARNQDELYFGLGERAGDANRHGNRYEMCNMDAMGYSARTTDPLYKHLPYYLTYNSKNKTYFGIFYDNLSDCIFDMGKELDNYHGFYRYYVAEHGDLDYYLIGGDDPAAITRRFTWLTGRPAFMPKWSLGYSGSTMRYTDAPDAQAQMDHFLQQCARHDILCSSFHLSSGYGSIGAKRYVFHWNRDKFPDPAAFAAHFRAHGVELCANIKPCLLVSHPRFAEVAARGLLVANPDGSPHLVQFWDEAGAYLDFTNPHTADWWQKQVTQALLQHGIAATWNDNNEFEIWNPEARVAGFGNSAPAVSQKPLQTLLMLQASRHAQLAFAPRQRPFLVSRAGFAGLQRYAQTWSGDNATSWETLKYNIRMGTGLALSGVSNLGHDIGGFAGPAPSPELLLRWVQFGIFLPRFSIHSWNDDGSANEPWMYPEIAPAIADLIKLRARLMPYLYHLAWRSHDAFEPMIRPTFYDFPQDPHCYAENDEMMLGPNLLVAAVTAPGQSKRTVYLPAGADWVCHHTARFYRGGRTVTVPAPLDRPVFLLRSGAGVPLNLAEQHFNQAADLRGFLLTPSPGRGRQVILCFEDDGSSDAMGRGQFGLWRVTLCSDARRISVEIAATGGAPPVDRNVVLMLPSAERRRLELVGGSVANERQEGAWRRITVALGP